MSDATVRERSYFINEYEIYVRERGGMEGERETVRGFVGDDSKHKSRMDGIHILQSDVRLSSAVAPFCHPNWPEKDSWLRRRRDPLLALGTNFSVT
ncbi:hypothetical protein CDAR_606021 [Caerostris darwini]|uniref:Uncharacterized protein n=1 Tax=Caerostris darwini TaxID=1538125 RepID=A0AAV4U5E9_9ARAC|nr:hypothetical protein CDAR_606021 [Caerostris darwini]